MNTEAVARLERSFSEEEFEGRTKEDFADWAGDLLRKSLGEGNSLPVKAGDWMQQLERSNLSKPDDDAKRDPSEPSLWDAPATPADSKSEDVGKLATVSKVGPMILSDALYEQAASRLTPEERKTLHLRRVISDMQILLGELSYLTDPKPKTNLDNS